MKIFTFGDSISFGYGAIPPTTAFPYLLSNSLGVTLHNFAVSGAMVPDQANSVYSSTPLSDDVVTLMLGTNDERVYGTSAVTKKYFADGLAALAVFIATSPVKAKSSGTYSGVWKDTYAYGIGRYSDQTGSKLNFSCSGTSIYIGYIRQAAITGEFSVKVDGIPCGIFYTNGNNIGTSHGISYGPALARIGNLTDSQHQVEIEVLSGRVYIDWWASNAVKSSCKLKILNIPYALAYNSGGSNENVDEYNAEIEFLCTLMEQDGLVFELVCVNPALTPGDMYDNYHPNSQGHSKIARLILGEPDPVSYTKTELFVGSDGNFYLGEDKRKILIQFVV